MKYNHKTKQIKLHKLLSRSIFMNMPTSVTVNNITGTTPFEVYLCLTGGTPCYYINKIDSAEIPYDFIVPIPLQDLGGYCIRIVDADGCIITECFTVT
jgi:hypothetical protein